MKEILHQLKGNCLDGGALKYLEWQTLSLGDLYLTSVWWKKNCENQGFNRITKRGTCSHVTFLSVCLLGFCEGEREGVRGFPLVMKGDFDIFFQLELHSEVRTRWAACPGPQRKKAQLFDRCPSILTLPKTNMFIIIIKKNIKKKNAPLQFSGT